MDLPAVREQPKSDRTADPLGNPGYKSRGSVVLVRGHRHILTVQLRELGGSRRLAHAERVRPRKL